jgi:hypothetical protein
VVLVVALRLTRVNNEASPPTVRAFIFGIRLGPKEDNGYSHQATSCERLSDLRKYHVF